MFVVLLVMAPSYLEVGASGKSGAVQFEQSVRITAASRVHHILGDARVEQKRNDFVDLIRWNSDMIPIRLMTKIAPEHRRKAYDQHALFISANASPQQIESLIDGTVRLRDINLEDQVQQLISVALSEPIGLSKASERSKTAALQVVQ